jgi:uncharacterized membrane protein
VPVKNQSSFGRIRSWFLQGIALVAPLALTLAFVFWLGRSLEGFVGGMLRGLLPVDWYLPGMGLVVALAGTVAVGLLANLFLVRWLVRLAERVLDRIPLIKSIFQGLKDIARFFSSEDGKDMGRPVAVDIQGMRLVGFVTQESARLPGSESDSEQIAVYLPMSYQLGGFTLYLDRSRVRALDVDTEQAMRAVITGGSLQQQTEQDRPEGVKE